MNYPTIESVESANRYQLCKWWRFLRSAETEAEIEIQTLIHKRYNELGGMNSKLSKQIGWDAK